MTYVAFDAAAWKFRRCRSPPDLSDRRLLGGRGRNDSRCHEAGVIVEDPAVARAITNLVVMGIVDDDLEELIVFFMGITLYVDIDLAVLAARLDVDIATFRDIVGLVLAPLVGCAGFSVILHHQSLVVLGIYTDFEFEFGIADVALFFVFVPDGNLGLVVVVILLVVVLDGALCFTILYMDIFIVLPNLQLEMFRSFVLPVFNGLDVDLG
jgi:hypothetical protein